MTYTKIMELLDKYIELINLELEDSAPGAAGSWCYGIYGQKVFFAGLQSDNFVL